MKFLPFYRLTFIAALAAVSPLALIAADNGGSDKPVRHELAASLLPMFQDSTVAKRKSEGKSQEKTEKSAQDVREERLKEAQRREIKQVPRSIPKLKPQPVTERAKIRRPPMKVPKKGMGGYRF